MHSSPWEQFTFVFSLSLLLLLRLELFLCFVITRFVHICLIFFVARWAARARILTGIKKKTRSCVLEKSSRKNGPSYRLLIAAISVCLLTSSSRCSDCMFYECAREVQGRFEPSIRFFALFFFTSFHVHIYLSNETRR
jgi:hypothetical protein